MKILYYDCFSGISGDMNLGAMIDLGVDADYLDGELQKLNLEGWKLEVTKDQRHGIFGTKVSVIQTRNEHHHRHLADIKKIILGSRLAEPVKELAMKIFMRIAVAEAEVHNCDIEKIHFHEVGAVDSIVDIVGAAICFSKLAVEAVFYTPLELGGGSVKCEHGIMPVPAPATAEIVKSLSVKTGGVNFEATTPTGAAIIAELSTPTVKRGSFKIVATGYGIGHKQNPDLPNILRAFIGETVKEPKSHSSLKIEANIDDMNPEIWDHVIQKLFDAGADDVFLSNISMKKNRPAILLNVLCSTENSAAIAALIFKETTTIGLREIPFSKTTLDRKFSTLDTPFGKVTLKSSYYNGELVSAKPELSECKTIADKNGIPLKNILSEIEFIIKKGKNE